MLVIERSSGLIGGQSTASDVKQKRKGSSGRTLNPRATLIELSVDRKVAVHLWTHIQLLTWGRT